VSGVLVTGARGFAGRQLIDFLAGRGMAATAWGRENVDLLDRHAVNAAVAELKPEIVYHLAGSAHVGSSFDNVTNTLAVNVLGTHHLLDALHSARLSARVLISGSSLVYRQSEFALREDHPTGPSSPYGLSKLAQEMLARQAIVGDGQHVLLTRSFNHTGPHQKPSYALPAFARQIALIEKGRIPPVIDVGNLDSARDLHDVRDTVRAYYEIATRGEPGRVYNVCSGRASSIREMLDGLLRLSQTQITVRIDPSRFRPNDNPIVLGDPTRIERELGWWPEIPLEKTLADLLDFWRKEVE
jgi:GDP-4-dehydro-6-deoxy-D-mannose reductase